MTLADQAAQMMREIDKHGANEVYLEKELRDAFNWGQLRACELRKIPVTALEIEEEGMKR